MRCGISSGHRSGKSSFATLATAMLVPQYRPSALRQCQARRRTMPYQVGPGVLKALRQYRGRRRTRQYQAG
eukprot:2135134-Rhodomonas_salina.1